MSAIDPDIAAPSGPGRRILQLNSARKYVGEAAHTLNLTECLRQRGHQVWLGLREGFETHQVATERGLNPIGFAMPHHWWPPQDWKDARKIAKLVRENRIEIIHAHKGKDHWLAALAIQLFRLPVQLVRTRHVVTPLSSNAGNRWLARHTAAMVVVSRAVLADVEGTGIYHGKLHFLPAGADLALFHPPTPAERSAARAALQISDSAPVAVCVARFAPVKAHSVLLDAWRQTLERVPDGILLLVGSGRLFDVIQADAKQKGLESSVRFLGKRRDVPQILAAADVGVLASIGSEGFSRAVLEYMAAALPVVGTQVGAVPDLVIPNETGELVPPNDASALARALSELLLLPDDSRFMLGFAGRELAVNNHSYAVWASRHEALYAKIADI